MAELIHQYSTHVRTPEGERFAVRAYAERERGGMWEGWLAFVPEHGRGPTLVTHRETSQASREAMESWALGVEAAYLQGAFARAHVDA